eukprot:TRINITY_DN40624_c0_g1_i1.p1 TRINITY_DN40624_c0_g1~~TRINITY_DN40624_c0_g1_i1.p1  ORF type:complete len:342 (+),score=102.48 TRINITY_DN40624_c0_g1_i1:65-1027(+)
MAAARCGRGALRWALGRCPGRRAASAGAEPELGEEQLWWLRQHAERTAGPGEDPAALLAQLARRRAAGEPLQYILGEQPFLGLDIACRPPVLIPRHDTELWVAQLAAQLASWESPEGRALRLLDVGSGAGAIALGLSAALGPSWQCTGFDYSPEAVALSEENLARAEGRVSPASCRFVQADLLSPSLITDLSALGAPVQYDCVVMNPPYVPAADWTQLGRECTDWEDKGAVVGTAEEGDPDGTGYHRRLIALAESGLLAPPSETAGRGGSLAMEVRDAAQLELVLQLLSPQRWGQPALLCGEGGSPRALLTSLLCSPAAA